MSKLFTVHRGASYKASFSLSGFESMASNDYIAQQLRNAGFENVKVWGSGSVRYASANWNKADATAPLPSQVHQIIRVDD